MWLRTVTDVRCAYGLTALLSLLVVVPSAFALDLGGPSRDPLPARVQELLVVPVTADGIAPPTPEQIAPTLTDAAALQARLTRGGLQITWSFGPAVSVQTPEGGCGRRTASEIDQVLQRVVDELRRQRVEIGERTVVGAFGKIGCWFAGYAGPQMVDTTTGKAVLLQGYGSQGFYDGGTLVHELSHTEGLWHANRGVCTAPRDVATCAAPSAEGGDPLDLMGFRASVYGYSAYSQTALGFDRRIVATLGEDGDYTLPAQAVADPPTTLVVPSGRSRALYLRAHGGSAQDYAWADGTTFGPERPTAAPGVEIQSGPFGVDGNPLRLLVGGTAEQYFADAMVLFSAGEAIRDSPVVETQVISASAEQAKVRVRWLVVPPPAPQGVTATPDIGGRLQIRWRPGTSADVRAISGEYEAIARPGGRSCTTRHTSCTITQLDPRRRYRVTVVARNTLTETASASSRAVRPYGRLRVKLRRTATGLRVQTTVRARGTLMIEVHHRGRRTCRQRMVIRSLPQAVAIECALPRTRRGTTQVYIELRSPDAARYRYARTVSPRWLAPTLNTQDQTRS